MQQVAENAWMGTGTVVNWLVVRDGRALTLVDSGWPGDVDALEASIRSIGHDPRDVTSVLLTHAHVDHIGGLNPLWSRYQIPVLMHPDEVPLAKGERREQATVKDIVCCAWRPRVARWAVQIMQAGAMDHPAIAHASAWPVGGPLDLPGAPVPVPCAGHTSGHSAYLFPSLGVIATGDALVTAHPVSGKSIPHLLPGFFNTDTGRAREVLDTLASVDADVVVPGHGYAWTDSIRTAVDVAAADFDAVRRWPGSAYDSSTFAP